jgi:hypothetical protein
VGLAPPVGVGGGPRDGDRRGREEGNEICVFCKQARNRGVSAMRLV